MKVGILVVLVVLPMFVSIGLYCYAFVSTNWIDLDNGHITTYNSTSRRQQQQTQPRENDLDAHDSSVQFEYRLIRQEFRSQYGLFGYCLDSKWLNILTIKTSYQLPVNSTDCDRSPSLIYCPELNTCVNRCNNILECPSHIDESNCIRNYDQTRYYWKDKKCLWHSFLSDIQGIPRWFTSYFTSSRSASNMKLTRYYIMLILFLTAPILTFFGLLVICCINCINRFYSIPFAFVGCFSLASFVSGASALGIFLYEWIQERFYQLDHTIEYRQIDQSLVALNPWIIDGERLGLAFWILLSAIGLNFLVTIISCCFCCGLQSDKSKLRIYVNNEKYAVIHTDLYDD